MSYQFTLATADDEAAIRALLTRNAVPGSISLTYEREPNYFLGGKTMGPFNQIIVARHQPSGQVAAVASRSIRQMYVNGHPQPVGYIGQLRVDEPHQGRWVVPQGFRYFHQLHQDQKTQGYLTTIIDGNKMAEGILVRRARNHFPRYNRLDRICTAALPLPQRKQRQPRHSQFDIRPGDKTKLPDIITFLNQHGAAKQFFPVFTPADFEPDGTNLDFCIEDFILAYHQGRLVGVMGLWDQSRYKQTIVQAYHGLLRSVRPLYNLGVSLIGLPRLVLPGQAIHFAYASFICVRNNDPKIFAALLAQVRWRAIQRGYAYLMVGLSEHDPLLTVVKRQRHVPYYSTLYSVCWQDDQSFHDTLDGRCPYVEIATL